MAGEKEQDKNKCIGRFWDDIVYGWPPRVQLSTWIETKGRLHSDAKMDHFMPTFTVNYGLKIDFKIQFTISRVIYNSFILFKITKKKPLETT